MIGAVEAVLVERKVVVGWNVVVAGTVIDVGCEVVDAV